MPEREYTRQELHTMQQDAIRRVREMQRRAAAHLAQTPASEPPKPKPQPVPAPSPGNPVSAMLDRLGPDKDTWLVLGLALLLYREGADSISILALLYLLF